MTSLLMGPLLGLEAETQYSICFLAGPGCKGASIRINGALLPASKQADTPRGGLWRASWTASPAAEGAAVEYRILLDGEPARDLAGDDHWQFHLPGLAEPVRIGYASCNGFSDFKLLTSTPQPYVMWDRLAAEHAAHPFSLLLMGGDQVYADSLWTTVPSLKAWNELDRTEKVKRKATRTMEEQLDRFYCDLYCKQWSRPEVARLLARVPSAMMWDDHDIFDGWGSYPEDLQGCDVYRAIYAAASRYFRLFQLRSSANASLLDPVNLNHHSWLLTFRGYRILALDNRATRTQAQVMSQSQWEQVNGALAACDAGHLLVMAGVPVVYRDFSFTEAALDATPWEEELTDDLKDHWRAKAHQGERARLIMRLLDNARLRRQQDQGSKTLILSGDVHVGCLGVIQDKREGVTNVHQLVSSGIVHPCPTQFQWMGILAMTNDNPEYLDENRLIRAELIKPFGAPVYLRTRNFATLLMGSDNKLWANWHCENGLAASYPLA
ncbi:alkaline phosphatase family protein [Aeromonas salmonicida]|uniref:alkaline phosphatase D family protein n=1 Tax=Aeromonas salmonicida TaxID=645 RepID=UPI00259DFB09|nr:alkaline phosphatase D family protein [Aeromonas salmonicida]ELI6431562.1 alkaline phosphatase family protein [Aeromonas salmonicida subsp. salmonicida]MDM5063451.1 alkaline phosphatase family protein [Aeromonas salmonicida]MDM5113803.1 alkaline phosphatase family protein [Aeromonas salmonicida]